MQIRYFLWLCILAGQLSRFDCFTECSFSKDDWCGYENVFDNGPLWFRQKAQEDSSFGPYIHSGESKLAMNGTYPMDWPPKGDHYLYTGPTNINPAAEKFAKLKSPLIHVNSTSTCLYFSYHNRAPVNLAPTLIVYKQNENLTGGAENDDEKEVLLAEVYSLNSAKWFEAQVPLPIGEYNLIIAGKNYNNRTQTGGLIAISNIAILEGECRGNTPEWLETPGDCGFENDLELCGYQYTNDSSVKLLNILAKSLSTYEQSQENQRKPPSDHFLAMTSQFYEIANQGNKAKLISPEISIQREGCILLWYYNTLQFKLESNNAFSMYQTEGDSHENLLFRLPTPKTNHGRWYQFNGALPKGTYRIILEVVYSSDFGENDYIGFDNIEIFNKSCSDVKSIVDVCDAETSVNHPLCRNQGTCVSLGKKSYRCDCGKNYFGRRCEHQYACAANFNYCHNGGTCIPDGKLDFRCKCQPGYEGEKCEGVKSCGSPQHAVKNARVVVSTNHTFGSTALFQCKDDWLAVGTLIATCNAEGNWDMEGKCKWLECGSPPTFSHLTLVNVTNTTNNGQAKYKCHQGKTTYENQDTLFCRKNRNHHHSGSRNESHIITGKWEMTTDSNQNIECHAIPACPTPPSITNGNVTSTRHFMDVMAIYRCFDRYEMEKNLQTFELKCSQNGQWMTKDPNTGQWVEPRRNYNNYYYHGAYMSYEMQITIPQCFRKPDCGSPPEVPHSIVKYKETTLNHSALYTCKDGYHLIGSEVAICGKVSDNRLEKWVEWLFIPSCESNCPVEEGRRGNFTMAKFQVSRCTLTEFKRFSSSLKCDQAMIYSVERKDPDSDSQDRNENRIIFTGRELCIAETVTKIRKFDNNVLYNVTKCESLCIQNPYEIQDILIYDELTMARPQNQQFGRTSDTKRQQTILRYETLSFHLPFEY